MVRIRPTIDEEELNRKLRHACPRIKRWKTRIDDADGDVHRMREQAINKSPVYVAIQRGSKNILIRTKTTPKWWRKWIQEGKKYGFDQSFTTPIHIPSEAYKYQRQISLTKKSPEKSPRRSVPVSPVKSRIHSPVKVSYLRNEEYLQSSRKLSPQKGVPMLTLTPVPLNQVLKRKARLVGNIATFGKGRWVDQDSSMLAVPGTQVYQYDSSSETDDDIMRKGGEILNKLITPPSPTETLKRLASAKHRDPMKSPKRSPQKGEEESDEEYPSSNRRIKSKIRAVGQTSLYFSPDRKLKDEDLVEESGEEAGHRSERDKSATIRKMRAVGTTKAALSPHKSPTKSPDSSPRTPGSMKKKIRAIGKTSAAFSPRKGTEEDMYDEDGNIISPGRDITQASSPSSIASLFRKIKNITRFSLPTLRPDASPSSISSLMTKIRFLNKLSPRRRKVVHSQEEGTEDEKEDEEQEDGEVQEKVKQKVKAQQEVEEDVEDEEEEKDEEEKESCLRKVFRIVCPCISRKKEPELMEYESGSQAQY